MIAKLKLKKWVAVLSIDGNEARAMLPMSMEHRKAIAEIARIKCRRDLRDHAVVGNVVWALEAAQLLRWNAEPEIERLRTSALLWRSIAGVGAVGWLAILCAVITRLAGG